MSACSHSRCGRAPRSGKHYCLAHGHLEDPEYPDQMRGVPGGVAPDKPKRTWACSHSTCGRAPRSGKHYCMAHGHLEDPDQMRGVPGGVGGGGGVEYRGGPTCANASCSRTPATTALSSSVFKRYCNAHSHLEGPRRTMQAGRYGRYAQERDGLFALTDSVPPPVVRGAPAGGVGGGEAACAHASCSRRSASRKRYCNAHSHLEGPSLDRYTDTTYRPISSILLVGIAPVTLPVALPVARPIRVAEKAHPNSPPSSQPDLSIEGARSEDHLVSILDAMMEVPVHTLDKGEITRQAFALKVTSPS
jgi:hypothetical protein